MPPPPLRGAVGPPPALRPPFRVAVHAHWRRPPPPTPPPFAWLSLTRALPPWRTLPHSPLPPPFPSPSHPHPIPSAPAFASPLTPLSSGSARSNAAPAAKGEGKGGGKGAGCLSGGWAGEGPASMRTLAGSLPARRLRPLPAVAGSAICGEYASARLVASRRWPPAPGHCPLSRSLIRRSASCAPPGLHSIGVRASCAASRRIVGRPGMAGRAKGGSLPPPPSPLPPSPYSRPRPAFAAPPPALAD